MINNEIELDHVDVEQNSITYSFRLINIISENLDIIKFNTVIDDNLKLTICQNKEMIKLLDQGIIIKCIVNDKNNIKITEFEVKRSDCKF